MQSNRRIVIGALLVAAVALSGAASLQPAIQRQRKELEIAPAATGELPVGLSVLNTGLGAFRGLLVDYLWMRAIQREQDGQYYEVMQLAEYITALQPRFADVWQFQASNMSFNIAVAMDQPEERWLWVQGGLQLLRDRGIKYNPQAASLYNELCHILVQKIAGQADDYNMHYKRFFAVQWQTLLGPPPAGTTEEVIAWFTPIAEAPKTLEQLVRQSPEVRAELDVLRKVGLGLDEVLLMNLARLELELHSADLAALGTEQRGLSEVGEWLHEWIHAESLAALGLPGQHTHEDHDDEAHATEHDHEHDDEHHEQWHGVRPAQQKLLAFVRARALRKRNMDPAFMLETMKKHGPLDWRHGGAHAVYWSERGLRFAEPSDFEKSALQRQLSYGLRQLLDTGRVFVAISPHGTYINGLPDSRYLQAATDLYAKIYPIDKERAVTPRENFLRDAVDRLYMSGKEEAAREYLQKLREVLPSQSPDRHLGLEELFITQFRRRLKGQRFEDQRRLIASLLERALIEGFGHGNRTVGNNMIKLAREAYAFHKRHRPAAIVEKEGDVGRLQLPPFHSMAAAALQSQMLNPRLNILVRRRLWAHAPEALKTRVWPELERRLYDLTRRQGLKRPENVFPPPGHAHEHEQEDAH